MKTIIHVNRQILQRNRKNGTKDPPITVKTYKNNTYCYEAGNEHFRVVYRPDKPLLCGAVCWVETHDKVEIIA